MKKYGMFCVFVGSLALAGACSTDPPGASDASAGSGASSGASDGKDNKPAGGGEAPGGGGKMPGGAGDAPGGAGPAPACTSNDDCIKLLGATTPADCAEAKCSATTNECSFTAVDADGDGYRTADCSSEDVKLEPGDDCNDADAATYPGAWDGPDVGGKEDRCDETDNDCNGKVDDATKGGATCVCDPAKDIDVACDETAEGTPILWPGGSAQGNCKPGKKTCINGAWSACEGAVLPKAKDACVAGDDASCNGIIEEMCDCKVGDQPRACGSNVGSCKPGTQACLDGKWATVCTGETAAKDKDSCQPGNDDNCNGKPNDKNPDCTCLNGELKSCATVFGSKGACGNGIVTCVGGKWPAECPVKPAQELCNQDGVDEDCDGNPNDSDVCSDCLNGQTSPNSCGTCGNGTRSCSNGKWTGCSGASGPYTYYQDADGDGYCNRAATTSQCSKPSGYLESSCSSDCRDGNNKIPAPTNRCQQFTLGSTSSRSCATFGAGCGVSNEWQISSDEAPGACPEGTHPKCQARWVSGNAGTQCWLASEDYNANTWSCRLHPSSGGFDGVTCTLDIACIPD